MVNKATRDFLEFKDSNNGRFHFAPRKKRVWCSLHEKFHNVGSDEFKLCERQGYLRL